MRFRIILIWGWLVILLALLSCSEDKPTAPGETGSDFGTVYFTNLLGDSTFYSFDTHEMKLDSFYLPFKPQGTLYLRNNKKELVLSFPDSVVSVNLETKLSYQFPVNFKGRFEFSEDELYLQNAESGIAIYRTSDYSLLFNDTTKSAGGCFSFDNNFYYSFYSNKLSVVDLTGKTVTDQIIFENNIGQVKATDQNNIILVHTYGSYDQNEFHIYDLENDSSVFVDTAGVERGLIEISPDAKYAFFTYGRSYIGFDKANSSSLSSDIVNTFHIYDIQNRSVYMIVNTQGFVPGDSYPFSAFYETKVTADGRYLVGCQYFHNYLVLFDLQSMQLDSYFETGELPFAIYGFSG